MLVININSLTVDEITYDNDYVYVKSGDNTVLISRVVVSRINALLPDESLCDFCSKNKETQEIYGDLEICKECLEIEEKQIAVAQSIEG